MLRVTMAELESGGHCKGTRHHHGLAEVVKLEFCDAPGAVERAGIEQFPVRGRA